MATTTLSLVNRVHDLLDDYGSNLTSLTAAISTTSATTCTVASATDISVGTFITIDYECMRVTGVATLTLTVVRGERGSTAATHADAATVVVAPVYPAHRVLNMLNAALGKMTKVVSDATTLDIVEDQFAYTIPSTIDKLCRVEVENSDETDEFYVIRNWELLDDDEFRIMGTYDTGRDLKCVGVSQFDALTVGGSLDTDFPDSNPNAINYLIYEATGQLLLQRQGTIASRDSFVGVTDAFAANYPDQSVRTARQYLAEAERYKQEAERKEAILQMPVAPIPSPTRRYLERL